MKAFIETYGCTANKADASLIKGVLTENKYKIVDTIDDADFIIILTCTVIDTTEQRMLSRFKKLKKSGKKVIVAGCMASIQKEKIKEILPDSLILPPKNSHNIVDLIEKNIDSYSEENKTSFPKYYEDIFAPVAIAEGCMFNCSYCITTHARGKLKSFPADGIKKDIKNAIQKDCKEIQITAQDTSSYGLDIDSNLGVLLNHISNINEEFRIRIGMMNPYTLMKNIDSIISGYKSDKIYKFLHLPVQSADNEILLKMNRKYTVEDFKEIIKQFKAKYPDICIATDVIIGFPTETDEQFQKTVDLIKKVKPDITNITRFSARPNTLAKKMKGRIPTEIVKHRSKILTDICSSISYENNLKYIGKKFNILITEKGKNNTFIGRAENYKTIVLKSKVEIGSFHNVEVIEASKTYTVGSII